MLDTSDLKKFASLPPVFTRDVLPLVENIIDEYDACRAYVSKRIDYYGEDAFKDPDVYQQVIYDIMWEKLPKSFEDELVAVVEQIKKESINGLA